MGNPTEMESGVLDVKSDVALMSEKVEVYSDVGTLFIEAMMLPKGKPSAIKQLGKKLSHLGIRLFIIAPDEVMNAYLEWRTLASTNEVPQNTLLAFANLLYKMRNDIVGETSCDAETALDLWG